MVARGLLRTQRGAGRTAGVLGFPARASRGLAREQVSRDGPGSLLLLGQVTCNHGPRNREGFQRQHTGASEEEEDAARMPAWFGRRVPGKAGVRACSRDQGGPWVGLAERGERLGRGNTGEPQTHSRQAEVMGQDRKVGDTEAILQEEWGLPSCSSG